MVQIGAILIRVIRAVRRPKPRSGPRMHSGTLQCTVKTPGARVRVPVRKAPQFQNRQALSLSPTQSDRQIFVGFECCAVNGLVARVLVPVRKDPAALTEILQPAKILSVLSVFSCKALGHMPPRSYADLRAPRFKTLSMRSLPSWRVKFSPE